MPELPDIAIYIESLQSRIVGKPLERIGIGSPFLLRTFDPRFAEAQGKKVLRTLRGDSGALRRPKTCAMPGINLYGMEWG
jgi:formamidopyrimidine-DNA glycosylase